MGKWTKTPQLYGHSEDLSREDPFRFVSSGALPLPFCALGQPPGSRALSPAFLSQGPGKKPMAYWKGVDGGKFEKAFIC